MSTSKLTNEKPFKTHNQQMKILRKRGLTVKSNDKRALEEHGYYSIVNGYKQLFLQKNSSGKPITPEQYIENASFKEIKSLYDFDKNLRRILYTPLMEYESNLKSEISYRFSKEHQELHSYLAIGNYSDDKGKIFSVAKTISYLSNHIQRNANKKSDENAISHYLKEQKHVPLWVLVNYLTFGQLNYFYSVCEDGIKLNIAKDFAAKYKRSYNTEIKISPQSIDSLNSLANNFRNFVAHNEITYSKKIFKSKKYRPIKNDLSLTDFELSSQCGVFELIVALKLVLSKKEYKDFVKQLFKLFDKYKPYFQSVSFDDILSDMNFPKNYREILKVK